MKESDSIDNARYKRWLSIVQLSGWLYSLPGVIDMWIKEVSHILIGNYSSERVIVFHLLNYRDRSVCKGPDVRRVVGRQLDMCRDILHGTGIGNGIT